ncbi:tRNA uridine-5-carboxymethylaminomethyl(34) synthesis GTPase MnmE [Arsenophonus symbiont of Ornithomya chloropus]|uniref:tRNA uridine-5-carboxymethylaminomethyl(34) synthesis GTPase MnmE n=1 Tax=Arsenophonus symbiont of Ornithomya chloropus TaxID=634121 RepID=UPI003D6CB98B
MIYINDTIIAQATPIGRGGIGILRISGPKVVEIAKFFLGKLPQPRYADYLPFCNKNGQLLDKIIVLYFPAPYSFTGEDILELHGHGGRIILDLLLQEILQIDEVRIAKPGEFSQRAFLNEKIDLTQAEAIADIIDANSEAAARSAVNSLQGVFSKHIHVIVEALINLRIYVEAAIDFPDEKINFLSENKIKLELNHLITDVKNIEKEASQANLLREGIKIVIAGPPNTGKSSLLNVLSGYETAIVTNVAGTTRDVLRENINIESIPFNIIDTAGLREAIDEVEKIGIQRAWKEIKEAHHVLFMIDSTKTGIQETKNILSKFMTKLDKTIPVTVIRNKVDISNEPIEKVKIGDFFMIRLSVHKKKGIHLLRNHLKKTFSGLHQHVDSRFLARRRHIQAINIALKHLQQGDQQFIVFNAIDLLAEELRLAQLSLNEITGKFTSDDLLSEIFSNFCIGK